MKNIKSEMLDSIVQKAKDAGFFHEFSIHNLRAGIAKCPVCGEEVFVANFSRKEEIIFACVCGHRQRL